MSKIDYPRAFYFVIGALVGCGADHFLSKLLGG